MSDQSIGTLLAIIVNGAIAAGATIFIHNILRPNHAILPQGKPLVPIGPPVGAPIGSSVAATGGPTVAPTGPTALLPSELNQKITSLFLNVETKPGEKIVLPVDFQVSSLLN